MQQFSVSQGQIQLAMAHYERMAPPRDGINICKEVSQLADLLGVMWYQHENVALVPNDSKVYQLLVGAEIDLLPGGNPEAPEADDVHDSDTGGSANAPRG